MRIRTRVAGLLVAMLVSTIMGVGVLAQEDVDTSTVNVQVHSGVFTVAVQAGDFSAVQPDEISEGSITMEVVDERADGGYWEVTASIERFSGITDLGTQRFDASIIWSMDEVSPSLILFNDDKVAIMQAAGQMFRGSGAKGTSTVSGDATVRVPMNDSSSQPLQSGTYSTTITVDLTSEDPS